MKEGAEPITWPSPFHLGLLSWLPVPPSQAVDSQELGSHRPATVEAIMGAPLRSKLKTWVHLLTPRHPIQVFQHPHAETSDFLEKWQVLYLNLGDGYTGTYICQRSLNCSKTYTSHSI